MKEEWKDIQGYEGLYQISNLGRVKSLKRFVNIKVFNKAQIKRVRKEYILNPVQDKDGYLLVHLYKSSKAKTFKVHRLVATNFLPLVINHKNGIKSDNKVSNLEWCTQLQNVHHSINTLKKEKYKNCRNKEVEQYSLNGEFMKRYSSITEAAKAINVTKTAISYCCNGKTKSCGGYIFRFRAQKE